MMLFKRVTAMAALAVSVIAGVAAQDAEPTRSWPRLLSEITAAAIDRGLREADPNRTDWGARYALTQMRHERRAYAPGSLIVKFRPGTSAAARRAVLALVGAGTTTTPANANFEIAPLATAADAEAAARALNLQADVEYAQPRYRVAARFAPNDPLYSRQWHYDMLDMERAWDINPGASASVIVAVIDTGVAFRSGLFQYQTMAFHEGADHFPSLGTVTIPFAAAPDLGGPERFHAPRDFVWDNANPLDLDGHGTHVAGTVGQATNNSLGGAGMAFNVRIMPVKVIDTNWDFIFNSPFFGTDDVVARGIRYAADNGAKVLNLSLGRTGPSAPVINDAIIYAVSRGAFVAVAAGNDFLTGNPIQRPADIGPQVDGLVTVGAVGQGRQRASYSSTGSYVELVAPGGDQSREGDTSGVLQQSLDFDLIDTFFDGPARYQAPRFDAFRYYYISGTSSATPHVSGFAAMLIQQGVTDPAAIEAIMKATAIDLGPAGRDNEYGHGLINPRAALRGMGLAK